MPWTVSSLCVTEVLRGVMWLYVSVGSCILTPVRIETRVWLAISWSSHAYRSKPVALPVLFICSLLPLSSTQSVEFLYISAGPELSSRVRITWGCASWYSQTAFRAPLRFLDGSQVSSSGVVFFHCMRYWSFRWRHWDDKIFSTAHSLWWSTISGWATGSFWLSNFQGQSWIREKDGWSVAPGWQGDGVKGSIFVDAPARA